MVPYKRELNWKIGGKVKSNPLSKQFPYSAHKTSRNSKISPDQFIKGICIKFCEVKTMINVVDVRKQKDNFFEADHHSPLSLEQKQNFQGLSYFQENPALRFDLEVKPFDEHDQVQMQTSTGEIKDYLKYGRFQFEVEGIAAELTVYTSDDGEAFVPFRDKTSGKETYGAGRYLELEHYDGNNFQVDFNLAYNPWCAYSPDYSCPIPPEENRLSVPIQAGEKIYDPYQDI